MSGTIPIIAAGRSQSLGILKTASIVTGVSATANLLDPTSSTLPLHILYQTIVFQALSGNTGVVYICNTATPTLTDGVQAGVLYEVPPPYATTVSRPLLSIGNPTGPSAEDIGEYYILPSVTNEGVRGVGNI